MGPEGDDSVSRCGGPNMKVENKNRSGYITGSVGGGRVPRGPWEWQHTLFSISSFLGEDKSEKYK